MKCFTYNMCMLFFVVFFLAQTQLFASSIVFPALNNFANPAALSTQIKQHRTTFGFREGRRFVSFVGTFQGGAVGPNEVDATGKHHFGVHLPYFESVSRLGTSPVVIGLSVDTPYFTKILYEPGSILSFASVKIGLRSTFFNCKAAVKISEHVALGFGVGPLYTDASLASSPLGKHGSEFGLFDTRAQNWTGNAGMFYTHKDKKTFIGLMCQLATEARLEGISYLIGGTEETLCKNTVSTTGAYLKLPLPYRVQCELIHRFPHNWLTRLVVAYTGLSTLNNILIKNTALRRDVLLRINYIDSWTGVVAAQKTMPLNDEKKVSFGGALGVIGAPIRENNSTTAFFNNIGYVATIFTEYYATKQISYRVNVGYVRIADTLDTTTAAGITQIGNAKIKIPFFELRLKYEC